MKRVNSRGIKQANKHVLMASLCYNLKKYLRFKTKNNERLVIGMTQKLEENLASLKTILLDSIQAILRMPNLGGKITHSKITLA